jgi:hypothetical protein
MGADNWAKVDPSPSYGGRIVVIPDRDAGRRWARDLLASLDGKVTSLTFLAPKVGKDSADHIVAGYGLIFGEVGDHPGQRRSSAVGPRGGLYGGFRLLFQGSGRAGGHVAGRGSRARRWTRHWAGSQD